MLQARLTVTQVMDLWHVAGALFSDEAEQGWTQIASFSSDIPLAAAEGNEDALHSMLCAIRLWSEMTIRG